MNTEDDFFGTHFFSVTRKRFAIIIIENVESLDAALRKLDLAYIEAHVFMCLIITEIGSRESN